jgi:hydrogenase maturation protein HypF
MLPYSPLHHLLLRDLNSPIVATSGNRSDEPICTDEQEAIERLSGIADFFLVHDRPIVRAVDDSVARIILDRELMLRRSRGHAPLPIDVRRDCEPTLAVGAHLKSTIALASGTSVFISQHIGDLETQAAFNAFERTTSSLQELYDARPQIVVCDLHPDYRSSQFAAGISDEPIRVQHHHAHIAACIAEHRIEGEVLGVCWDGTGYGLDGTVWGGEILLATPGSFRRLAYLKTFALPGGDRAIHEPRRSAFGVLYGAFWESVCDMDDLPPVRAFTSVERRTLAQMIDRGIHAPVTSSMGRLFDAVAALLDLRQSTNFEGQAAMELEFAVENLATAPTYPFEVRRTEGNAWILDWAPMIRRIVVDIRHGTPPGRIAASFHCTLIDMLLAIVERAGLERVILSGGCFQNMILLESAVHRLRAAGFEPYWPQRIPPNDGGIALGQIVVANATLRAKETLSCA